VTNDPRRGQGSRDRLAQPFGPRHEMVGRCQQHDGIAIGRTNCSAPMAAAAAVLRPTA
jgi:hypothetical protein